MTKKQKFEIKMDLIKHEILVLNEKMNSLTSNLWKIRQIALGIWLAAFGVGLGALNQIGKTNPILLFISFLVPIWFWAIDTRYVKNYRKYRLREKIISEYLSRKEFLLPSNKESMSFDECLDSEVITFPIFDLDGKASYGQQEYHRWRTGVWSNLFGLVPLFFYGTQIIASVLFATLEVYKSLMHPMVYTPTLILYPK